MSDRKSALKGPMRGGLKDYKSKEGWREQMAEEMLTKENKDISYREHIARPRIQLGMALNSALNRAAHKRGMSRVGYIRRAVAAFAANDLGEDFKEILLDSPSIDPYRGGTAGGKRVKGSHDDGEGYGDWKITGLGPQDG